MDTNVLHKVSALYDLTKVYTEEAALLADAMQMLALFRCYVIRKDANLLKGFPDILASYRGRFVGIELKDNKGKLSPHQEKQIQLIQKSGGVAGGCRTLGEIIDLLISSEV